MSAQVPGMRGVWLIHEFTRFLSDEQAAQADAIHGVVAAEIFPVTAATILRRPRAFRSRR